LIRSVEIVFAIRLINRIL